MRVPTLIASIHVLALAIPAHAGPTLYTPPLTATGGAEHLECRIANVGTSPVTVNVRLVGDNGVTVASSGDCTLPAGQGGCTAQEDGDSNLGGPSPHAGRCEFAIVNGSRRSVRAAIRVVRTSGGAEEWATALPAD